MEETKNTVTILITIVEKSTNLSPTVISELLNIPESAIATHSSPKGWRVDLEPTIANSFLEKGLDTLNGEDVNFAEADPFCTVYIKGVTNEISDSDLKNALKAEGNI